MYADVQTLIKTHDGVIRTSEAMKAGISRTTLSTLARNGQIERVARGQYILPNEFPDELYIWQQRMNRLIYSHETALFLHDMAERTPLMLSATLPSTTKLSATFPEQLKIYYVKSELHEMGTTILPSKFGHDVCAYDIERTICDIVRSRSRIDDQSLIAALKNYAARPDKNLQKLGEYANIFRITNILRSYLEILL